MSEKIFCPRCNKEVEYKVIETDTHTVYQGQNIEYKRKDIVCPDCGNYFTMMLPDIFKENFNRIWEIIRKEKKTDDDSSSGERS